MFSLISATRDGVTPNRKQHFLLEFEMETTLPHKPTQSSWIKEMHVRYDLDEWDLENERASKGLALSPGFPK